MSWSLRRYRIGASGRDKGRAKKYIAGMRGGTVELFSPAPRTSNVNSDGVNFVTGG